jgi:hypothetical protein
MPGRYYFMRKVISILVLVMVCIVVYSPLILAAEKGYELKADSVSIRDILIENNGKRVILRIESGETLEGTVTRVGESVVHISKLTTKDYYDAVVRIDRISAVIFKVRG